jgi:hypothetical protein
MKVICKTNDTKVISPWNTKHRRFAIEFIPITPGKIYETFNENLVHPYFYRIKDDSNQTQDISKEFFITLIEYRKEKLDKILL